MAAIAFLSADAHVAARLRTPLEESGFETETAQIAEIRSGELDLLTFFEEHDPNLVIYELTPPYAQSLTFMRLLQSVPMARHRRWMLATIDRAAVIELLGPTDAVLEVPARGEDPAALVQAIRRELEPPPRRTEAA